MQDFDFLRPKTLSELTGVLAETGGRILAGGTDIIPKMRPLQFATATLVDISQIHELRFIREQYRSHSHWGIDDPSRNCQFCPAGRSQSRFGGRSPHRRL